MIAHQRLIREAQAAQGDGHPVPSDFSRADVREISYSEAKEVILKYEWLGTMGTTRRCFGLFFDGELAGVECFGMTAGTGVSNLCGPDNRERVMTLVRGACVHWAHKDSASFLITRACRMLAKEGKNIFVAYSDTDAGEIGTVYQAANWFYCGKTADRGSLIVAPSGTVRDERCIAHFVRDRCRKVKTEMFFRKMARSECRRELDRTGHKFVPRTPKHRYVGIYAEPKLRRELIDALRWNVLPYPKRQAHRKESGDLTRVCISKLGDDLPSNGDAL